MTLSWIVWTALAQAAAPLPVNRLPCPAGSLAIGAPPFLLTQDPIGSRYGSDIELPPATVVAALPGLKKYFDWERAVAEAAAMPNSHPFDTVPLAYLQGWYSKHRDRLPANFESLDARQRGDAIIKAGLLDTLPDTVQGLILVQSTNTKVELGFGWPQRLRLRDGAPESLKRWMFHRDGDALEWALSTPVDKWEQGRSAIHDLTETLNVTDRIFHEQGPAVPVHIHMSRREAIPVTAIHSFQADILLEAGERGQKTLKDVLASRYTSAVPYPENDERGVVRQPGRDPTRLEVRMVINGLDATVDRFRAMLALPTDKALADQIGAHLAQRLGRLDPGTREKTLLAIGNHSPWVLTDLYDGLSPVASQPAVARLREEILQHISDGLKRSDDWGQVFGRSGEYAHWTDAQKLDFIGAVRAREPGDPGQLPRVLRMAGFDPRIYGVSQILDQARVVVGGAGGDARVISAKNEEDRVNLVSELGQARQVQTYQAEPSRPAVSEDPIRELRRRLGLPD